MTSQKKYLHSQQNLKMLDERSYDPKAILQRIKDLLNDKELNNIDEAKETFNNVIPLVIKTMQQVYSGSSSIVKTNDNSSVSMIRSSLQIALNLMEISNNILEFIMRNNRVLYSQVPCVPVNMASIIFYTFDHCKNSQQIYNNLYKSVPEILELFKKTQEVHTKFLNFLDNYLIFDFFNETEVLVYKNTLDVILKISKTLSGVNMKSMTDNWKSFITLLQKILAQNPKSINISSAIQLLTEEVDGYLSTVSELEVADSKKAVNLKVTGFLLKAALKLFEISFGVSENDYDVILKFWIIMYNHGTFFIINKISNEIMNSASILFQLCKDSLPSLLSQDSTLVKTVFLLNENSSLQLNLGLLFFISDLMKEVPRLSKNDPELLNNIKITSILQLLIRCLKNCYVEYFCCHNSNIYDELIINVCCIILMIPSNFFEVEITLLECIIEENIWLSLVAMDIWCLVLRHSTENVCRLTFSTLVKKIEELRVGVLHDTAVIIRLKIFTQRIFKILSDYTRNEELSKYNPSSNLSIWRIISLRNISLSHRYYVEFITSDILERIAITEKETSSAKEFISLIETVELLSYTNFRTLEINISRLIPIVDRLWLFNIETVSFSNSFFKLFILKLMKFTIATSEELSGENLLLVLNQTKLLLNDESVKLLTCFLLYTLWRRNFNDFEEKFTLFVLIADIYKILISDKNPVIVEQALGSFRKISCTSHYEPVVQKLMNDSPDIRKNITDYMQKSAVDTTYNVQFLQKYCNAKIQHQCIDCNNYQPSLKKIKIDDDSIEIDVIVRKLKTHSDSLFNVSRTKKLNVTQIADIKNVLDQLNSLLK